MLLAPGMSRTSIQILCVVRQPWYLLTLQVVVMPWLGGTLDSTDNSSIAQKCINAPQLHSHSRHARVNHRTTVSTDFI